MYISLYEMEKGTQLYFREHSVQRPKYKQEKKNNYKIIDAECCEMLTENRSVWTEWVNDVFKNFE